MWVSLSVAAAFFSALTFLANQYFKVPGHQITFWGRVMTVLCLFPFLFILELPSDTVFYIANAVSVLCVAYGDSVTHRAIAEYGGGVVSRLTPLMVWLGFFFWILFAPDLAGRYLDQPLRSLGILAALSGCVYFAARLRRCEISKSAFKMMLPPLLLFTLAMAMNKLAMDHSPVSGAAIYAFLQSLGTIFVLPLLTRAGVFGADARLFLVNRRVLAAGACMGLFWTLHMIFKSTAFKLVENPAYVAAVMLTAPLMIALIYKAVGHREEADVISGFGVVASVIVLTFLTLR